MSPKLIDTHCHLNFHSFREDCDEVIGRALVGNVWLVNVGTQFETSRRAVEMAEQYSDGVYATVGLHPIHLFEHHVDEEETAFLAHGEEFNIASYEDLVLRSPKTVAIGEFGLDYFRMPKDEDEERVKTVQREVVRQHIILAKKVDKPLMVHCREAYDDLIALLKEEGFAGRVNIHSFTGSWEQAKMFLDMGYTLGMNGIITFDKTGRSREVVKNTPLDRILLETDSPYLTPEPHRGKRNEPAYVKYVAEKIAEIQGADFDEVAGQTTKNAREFFAI